MIIGTPFTQSALRVLLLGSGGLSKEISIVLQNFGIEVTAASVYPQAPAQQISQKAITVDLSDGEELGKIIQQEKPHYIFTETESVSHDVLEHVEKTGLSTVVPMAQAISKTTNREKIKQIASMQLGLTTAAFDSAESPEELESLIENKIGYPCLIKPTLSSSEQGQSVINTPEEIKNAWEKANSSVRSSTQCGTVLVESFLEFDYEITLLTVSHKTPEGKNSISFCAPIAHARLGGDYHESWQPAEIPCKALARAKQYAHMMVQYLGGTGLFGVDFFVRGEEVWFSDISARPHEAGFVTLCTQHHSEFELHIRAALGLGIDVNLRSPGAMHTLLSSIHASEVVYENLPQALSNPQVSLRLFGKPNAWIKRKMGFVLANGHDTNEARFSARKAAQEIIIRAAEH